MKNFNAFILFLSCFISFTCFAQSTLTLQKIETVKSQGYDTLKQKWVTFFLDTSYFNQKCKPLFRNGLSINPYNRTENLIWLYFDTLQYNEKDQLTQIIHYENRYVSRNEHRLTKRTYKPFTDLIESDSYYTNSDTGWVINTLRNYDYLLDNKYRIIRKITQTKGLNQKPDRDIETYTYDENDKQTHYTRTLYIENTLVRCKQGKYIYTKDSLNRAITYNSEFDTCQGTAVILINGLISTTKYDDRNRITEIEKQYLSLSKDLKDTTFDDAIKQTFTGYNNHNKFTEQTDYYKRSRSEPKVWTPQNRILYTYSQDTILILKTSGSYNNLRQQWDFSSREFKDDCTLVVSDIKTPFNVPLNVRLFPNPAQNTLNILFAEQTDNSAFKCQLININGQIFKEVKGHNTMSIDIEGYPSGMYFLKIIANQKSHIHKVFIQR